MPLRTFTWYAECAICGHNIRITEHYTGTVEQQCTNEECPGGTFVIKVENDGSLVTLFGKGEPSE